MADKTPIKANFTGSDVTSLGEFATGDTVPVASGGTGATTAAAALTNLGAAALAGSTSQSFSMLNGTVAGMLTANGGLTSTSSTIATVQLSSTNTSGLTGGAIFNGVNSAPTTTYFSGVYGGITSNIAGAETGYLALYTRNGTDWLSRLAIDHIGAVTIPGTLSLTGASSTLGYGTGAGGTVTQATSKSTTVTLNKACGQITMDAASLAAGASVVFSCANSLVTDSCVVATSIKLLSVADLSNYRLEAVGAGVSGDVRIVFRLTNLSAGALAESPVINFEIFSGATS